jgi:hypothetical protein
MSETHVCSSPNMPILPYLIKGGVHTYSLLFSFFTSMAGPDSEAFASHLNPTLRNDIASFVSTFYISAKSTHDPKDSLLNRFKVTSIGINKAGSFSQHESLAVWVLDEKTSIQHEFVVERGPSKHSHASRFAIFTQFPQSHTVLESIRKAISNMRGLTSQEADSLSASMMTVTETELIPLLPMTFDSFPVPEPFPPSENPPTSSSVTDVLTSTLARGFALTRTASQTLSPQSLADDCISGRSSGTLRSGSCIRLFNPVKLSLFDVVLLGHVVHDYAPIYGLFDNMCYMFANVIFDAIVENFTLPQGSDDIDNLPPSTSSGPLPHPTIEVGAPHNANLMIVPRPTHDTSGIFTPFPADNGRWSGLLIIDPIVKQEIVKVVSTKFKSLRTTYIERLSA